MVHWLESSDVIAKGCWWFHVGIGGVCRCSSADSTSFGQFTCHYPWHGFLRAPVRERTEEIYDGSDTSVISRWSMTIGRHL